jgi:hypothetical protein
MTGQPRIFIGRNVHAISNHLTISISGSTHVLSKNAAVGA